MAEGFLTTDNIIKGAALNLIALYQRAISPLLGCNCRFYPSCSSYAREALEKYEAARALKLIIVRILKCGPWSDGGFDPVVTKQRTIT